MAAVWGYAEKLRILCTRELQVSIKESFWAEVKKAIATQPFLAAHYEVGESYIRGRNGTEFIFRGLRTNMSAIKSMADIDLAIVEEAEDVPEASWRELTPTIRSINSEIWVVWNPRASDSPVDKRFRKNASADTLLAECHYYDNPWFPPVLDAERRRDQQRLDPATYAHIWEGAYLEQSNAQILANKVRVAEFTPGEDWDGPYFGLDFGFAQDPTAAVKCWAHNDSIYIEYEAGKVGLELDATAAFLQAAIPGIERHTIRADSARPESISFLRRHGLPNITAVKKWSGSVEDGIAYLRGRQEIVIHPRCRETIQESRLYSYKTDRLTGDILPQIVDAHNHFWDSTRYALEPMMRVKRDVIMEFI